jgi:hypothetical protein
MPIPIIIAILLALFTLGAKMHQQKGSTAQVVIIDGKQYYQVHTKENRDTLVLMAPRQRDHSTNIQVQQETAPFENIFQFSGLYQIIKAEHMTVVNNSINSNMKQAIACQ